MICITDSTGVTVKSRIQDENHVRIGITQISLWVDGTRRSVRDIAAKVIVKPWCEFTINEMEDLLGELHELEFWADRRKAMESS